MCRMMGEVGEGCVPVRVSRNGRVHDMVDYDSNFSSGRKAAGPVRSARAKWGAGHEAGGSQHFSIAS